MAKIAPIIKTQQRVPQSTYNKLIWLNIQRLHIKETKMKNNQITNTTHVKIINLTLINKI